MKLTKKNILNIGFEKVYSKGIEHFNIKPFGSIPTRLSILLRDKLNSSEYYGISSIYEKQFEFNCNGDFQRCYVWIVVRNKNKYLCADGIEDYWVDEISTIEDVINNDSIKYFLKNEITEQSFNK